MDDLNSRSWYACARSHRPDCREGPLLSELRRSQRPSDAELLRRVAARDPSALEVLYDSYGSYVMGIALKITGERAVAEEVTQDVFWKVWRSELRYDPERGRFTTWLFAVARNRSLDRIRGRARQALDPLEKAGEIAHEVDPELEAASAQQRDAVHCALEQLAAPQREAIELNYFKGMSHAEIAEALGEPLGTIKSRIKRGLVRLREVLAEAHV